MGNGGMGNYIFNSPPLPSEKVGEWGVIFRYPQYPTLPIPHHKTNST
jgi:hypothetical protein